MRKNHILKSLALFAFSFLLMSPSCKRLKDAKKVDSHENTLNNQSSEKPTINYSFHGTFNDQWKIVDSLENIGLYKSALQKTEEIFIKASKEDNTPQIVRTLMYKMKYNSYLEEDDFIIAINELTLLSLTTESPLKQIIHSVLADVYWGYYQNNRWKFLNRSTTVNFKNEDIRTWDLAHIINQVNKHNLLALTDVEELQHSSLKDFSAMLILHEESEKQRPTLYDFLAFRSLDYFMNTESSLNRPLEKFTISGAKYFGDASTFLQAPTGSNDSLSNDLHAVRILKELTRFHLTDDQPEALVDLELKRLNFIRSKSTDDNKDQLYSAALNKLSENFKGKSVDAEIRWQIANYLVELGKKYSSDEPENRWELKKAVEICSEAIEKYPNTFGASQCNSLLETIKIKQISFETETAYLPNSTGKILFNYTNIDSVYFRLIKVDADFFFKTSYFSEELINEILKKESVDEWSKKLNNPQDFQQHSIELLIPNKSFGHYLILASPTRTFSVINNAIAHSSYWVSNMGFSYRRNDDETNDVIVSDRETGIPLENVTATIFINKYNHLTRRNEITKQESHKTDKYGMFTIRQKNENRNVYIDLENGEDHFNNSNQFYLYNSNRQNKSYSTTNFYTDRLIYRPGQTVFFKAIRISHNGDNHTLETGKQSIVEFRDANNQKVTEIQLTTNNFGTFSGSFKIPEGGMTGEMHINDAYGSHYFSVEEYKRPKFEITFEPLTGVYKIGKNITVKGIAKSFAGANIDGANVQFSVNRTCNFPSWIYYKYSYFPRSASTEILNGTIKTDENGEFSIHFLAKEDKTIDTKYVPYYTYSVTVDVTDITGETHSSAQNVTVGYTAMQLSIDLPEYIERNSKNRFHINATNLDNQKVSAEGSIKVTRLIEPDVVFRPQLWNRPDLQELSEIEFKKLFPHDVFKDEDNIRNYSRGEIVIDRSFNTPIDDSIDFIGMNTWQAGRYVIEAASIDSFGTAVKDIKYIVLLDKSALKNPTSAIWSISPLKTYCEPGEVASVLIYSATDNFKIIYEIEHKGKIINRELLTLSEGQKLIEIPIEEKYRGNITIHFNAVKYGRTFTAQQLITVPFSNKELAITFETFRDKLLPGQKEEWLLKIKGPKGEKLAAEMLAAMYDASLNEFAANSYALQIYNSFYSNRYWYSNSYNKKSAEIFYNNWNQYYYVPQRFYNELNYWGFNRHAYYQGYYPNYRGIEMLSDQTTVMQVSDSFQNKRIQSRGNKELESIVSSKNDGKDRREDSNGIAPAKGSGGLSMNDKPDELEKQNSLEAIQSRTNLNETAFFYPHLRTNDKGEVIIKFTIPESLTKWQFIGLAHTKDLKIGTFQKDILTQKELMVVPNAPRFLREGDTLTFTAKVSNLTSEELNGSAQLMLFDAYTMKPIDDQFSNINSIIDFSAKKGQSARLAWKIEIPSGIGAVVYRVVAKANNHTDGEENVLPILSNRMLVTESIPLPTKGIGKKNFTFTKLINSDSSATIRHHKLTLEYTSNPAWFAIQAMPYMMEYPHECSEQIFTRFYANALASTIVNSNPKIKQVFESWKQSNPEAFLSNLNKNEELKSLMLEETPWLLDAQNESERKNRVALLFDLNKMDNELNKAIRKLERMQVPNGAWSWFPGMPESNYITQYMITGMGHLDYLKVRTIRDDKSVWQMVTKGIQYLDEGIIKEYNWLKSHDSAYNSEQRISQSHIQYLYARSYFKDIPITDQLKEAFDYYQNQAATYWKNFNLYAEGMIALQAFRYNNPILSNQIIASIKERAILNDELGMYWKDNISGYYWFESPIETQALLIEAFDEISKDLSSVEEMKVWLLKQKQTNDWKTTKATAEACYALLLRGTELLSNTEQVEIKVNEKIIDPAVIGSKVEAGTGYFKTSWSENEIKPEMGNISITRKTNGVSWGAMYWQYFEDLDQITQHNSPLSVNKKLFKIENTDYGQVINPVTDNTQLQPGDKIRIRIELRSDRDMEYVHMKDMRAAGFEPTNVFTNYKWQDGLGYYESTRDAATNFFMDYLPKGIYVFEYDLMVNHSGDFSNGITTIQCMYAPEFTSHSEGIRVKVTE